MARNPSTPCAGGCGRLLWGSGTSLPAGQRTCQPCRRDGRSPLRESRECAVCGSGFHPNYREQVNCSRQCGAAARRAKRRPVERPRRTWTCEVCGVAYRRSYSGQRTCGRVCGAALKARNRSQVVRPEPPPKICAQCGSPFTGSRHRYCSAECSARAARVQDLRRYGKTPDDADRCESCGVAVPFKRKRCDDCKLATVRAWRKRRKRKVKARLRGVAHEPYTLAEIAIRDRGVCQLCRKRVAMSQVVPHPKAPTIDHVLPIAAGGQDVRANVQLAHFECNWQKSDGGTQQLALIG